MAVAVEQLERQFVFDGRTLPDPHPALSVEQARDIFMTAHPEITTATVAGPEAVDGKLRYTFTRAVGIKG